MSETPTSMPRDGRELSGRARWGRVLVTLGVSVVLVLIVIARLEVSTDITRFLAPGDDPRAAEVSARLSRSELSRTMIVLVRVADGTDASRNRAAAETIATALRDDEAVAWVRTGVPRDQQSAVYELYQPRRFTFGSTREGAAEWVRAQTTDAALSEAARSLRRELAKPTGMLVKRMAPEDPLSLFASRLGLLQRTSAADLDIVDDGFVTADGDAVVFLATRASAFDATAQREVQARLAAAVDEASRTTGPITVAQSGVGRFAIAAESTIRGDIVRISALGTIGVALLFMVVFRSPALLLLSMVPLALGGLAATAVVALVYGEVHGLTLAFGGSLLGICIDYPVHLSSHIVHERAVGSATPVVRASHRVRPGLILGAGTTLVGFVGLGWTSFPGIREIALFASVGIAVAVAVTLYTLPALVPRSSTLGAGVHTWLEGVAGRVLGVLDARPWFGLLPVAVAAALVAAGAGRIEFADDPRALTQMDPSLLEEDERVRAAVSRLEASQMVLAMAPNESDALELDARVHEALERLRADDKVDRFTSLHPWLTSPRSQAAHWDAWQAAREAGLEARLVAAFSAEGFKTDAFARFFEDLEGPAPAVLEAADLQRAGLADLVSAHLIETPDGVALVTYLRGVQDADALARAMPKGAVFFDQGAVMRRAYAAHRRQGTQLLLVGLVGVLLVLIVRYRSAPRALAAFLPSVLAAAVTMSILALAGTQLHLLHVISSLLVMSMGVDYGVFLAESGERKATTLVSLALACVSTVLAFGLLAWSSNPALHAVGVTTGLGVAWSLLLAPSLLTLAKRPGAS